MNHLKAVVTIIRLPNVLFIWLTQILVFKYLVHPPLVQLGISLYFNAIDIFIFSGSTALIAAGGYIINDYFDVGIDAINKPNRVTVEHTFKRRTIMLWHIFINALAVLIACYYAIKSGHISLALFQISTVGFLILYSSHFKRQAFIGNLCIALLTALTVLLPYLFENVQSTLSNFYNNFFSLLFITVFSFFITWLREIIKDIEDIKGDKLNNCNTMPIKYGISYCKNYCVAISVVIIFWTIIGLSIIHCNNNTFFLDTLTALFCAVVIIPICVLIIKLSQAYKSSHFKYCSRLVKIITFAGIILIVLL
jgi:4-hydroxybenzoate polyprenyltransferase